METGKSSTNNIDDPVDEARKQLCQRLADGLRGGACSYQVRFQLTKGTPTEVWIYAHSDHDWRKRDDLPIRPAFAGELLDQFEMLSKRDFSDVWSLRRVEHSDRIDFELKFRHDVVTPHLGAGLESYLLGCMFLGHHDSGKDARHGIRFRDS